MTGSVGRAGSMAPLLACAERIHLLDWITVIAVFAFAGSLPLWATPKTRAFALPESLFSGSSEDAHFAYSGIPVLTPNPSPASRVPTGALMVLCIAAPIIIITVSMLFLRNFPSRTSIKLSYRPRCRLLNLTLLGLLTSLAVTLLLTETLKNIVGKQRPDFWGRCGGVVTNPEMVAKYTVDTHGPAGVRMVTWEICRSYWSPQDQDLDIGDKIEQAAGDVGGKHMTRAELRDGWRSFPSGHASLSFAGLGYLSVYLAHVLCSRSIRRRRTGLARLVVTLAPVFGAGYVAATRYGDLKHYGYDILAGSLIGCFGVYLGWWWWRQEIAHYEEEAVHGQPTESDEEEDGQQVIEEVDVGKTGTGHVVRMSVSADTRDSIHRY